VIAGRPARWLAPSFWLARSFWLAPPLLLLLAACTSESPSTAPSADTPSPFADCAALAAAPPSAASAASAPAVDLPDLALPCFTGGQSVSLHTLRGPAVLNLWASWCGPCRTELPAMQRLADRAAGKVHVIGVDTGDRRDAAASFGADTRIAMPTLVDADQSLAHALGKINLPVTVFVDAAGTTYVYNSVALDDARLAELTREHTGVAVPS
jgi:cytochrome c biogenesis protein CcmG/thiol:disulfide interchange protein DsbE